MEEGEKLVWRFGRWAQLETLLHEQVHLWQQNFGKDPVKPGRVYHNKEFVEKCESMGLHPKIGEGYHLKLADGPFAILMRELGIAPPGLKPATARHRLGLVQVVTGLSRQEAQRQVVADKMGMPRVWAESPDGH